jgi:hypothetical protein
MSVCSKVEYEFKIAMYYLPLSREQKQYDLSELKQKSAESYLEEVVVMLDHLGVSYIAKFGITLLHS